MKKHIVFTATLLLASPLLMAQTGTGSTDSTKNKAKQTTQQALPGGTSLPGTSGSDDNGIDTPSTDDEGNTSTGARSDKGSISGSMNPEAGTGKIKAKGGQADFASFDINADGKLSRDELKADSTLTGKFDQLDRNRDGNLSRGEYTSSLKASSKSPVSSSNTDEPGSDRTDKDDGVARRLGGG